MKDAARAKWLASFDMEELIGSILRRGMWLGIGLIAAGAVLRWAGMRREAPEDMIQGTNVFHVLSADLSRVGSATWWPALLVHGGMVVVLYTPYLRVAASVLYFASVQRHWKHALLESLVLVMLTSLLFLG